VNRSKGQRRTEQCLTSLHAHVRNVRRDALHKLTTELAATHGAIVVEKLNARELCRAGNRGLRRGIHDASTHRWPRSAANWLTRPLGATAR
jgi:putative transposase